MISSSASVLHNHSAVRRVERALRLSTLEGMAYGAVLGFGERFAGAYGVALGASNLQVALLTTVPVSLGAASQLLAARLSTILGSRKRVVLLGAALSGLMWLPIMSIGFFLKDGGPVWLIAFLSLYIAFTSLTAPAWGSIMAEVVPDRIRGRYFGQRSRWSTLANVVTFFLAGGLLYLLRGHGLVGFALAFLLAMAFRMVSAALLATLVELPHSPKDDDGLGAFAFFKQLPSTNLGRITLYLLSVNFVVNLAAPLFVPYMLRELEFSYITFTALELASMAATILAVSRWGAVADKAGNRKVLALSGVMISLVPLLWLVSPNPVYLAFAQLYSGLAWAGFNLVSINFIYDATTPRTRTSYLAYFNAGMSIAAALGALTGGLLVGHVPAFMGSAILTMFVVSGVLRLTMAAAFLPHVREVRRVRTLSSAELFHIMLGGRTVHRPVHGAHVHAHHTHGHKDEEQPTV